MHGTITIKGTATDTLQALTLEVLQAGVVVAKGELTAGLTPTLLTAFGTGGQVSVTSQQLLFEVPSAEAAKVDGSKDGTVTLRVRARSASGEEVTKDAGAVQLLVKYDGANRYGERDEAVGGDDWLRPSLQTLVSSYQGLTWGDFSNMNAGPFQPHSSHRLGLDVDGWFPGYNDRNAATAARIVAHLNDAAGKDIAAVFVTYRRIAADPFWQAIKGVTLGDGRRASDVILPVEGHESHFHWRKN